MSALNTIERFPTWDFIPPRAAEQKIDWVALGSEYDISRLVRLWQRVMRFRFDCLPEDESVMWQLADRLSGRRSDIVRIQEAVVSIDRRHMSDFREGMGWLWDHICEEHADELYVNKGTKKNPRFVRIKTGMPPFTTLEDAQTARAIIDALCGRWVDNVIKLRDSV